MGIKRLSETLMQTVIVENKSCGGGAIGRLAVANAPPDATILAGNNTAAAALAALHTAASVRRQHFASQ